MGYWEWPEWSIVLNCVLFLVLMAVYVFVVGVPIVRNKPELGEFINIHLAKLGGVLRARLPNRLVKRFWWGN